MRANLVVTRDSGLCLLGSKGWESWAAMACPVLCLLNASTNTSPGTKLQASSLTQYCCWSLAEVTWRGILILSTYGG